MQTNFDSAALAQPDIAAADAILRRCVHCGFCTATCPTYQLTGDELDGPRGRIYLIKNLLENPDSVPSKQVTTHLDRCLGCLACSTTCPSEVNYGELLDITRSRQVAASPKWSLSRLLRKALIALMIRPVLFRCLLWLGRGASPLAPVLPHGLRAMAELAKVATEQPKANWRKKSEQPTRGRVVLLKGCVQQAAGAHINAAAQRLLSRAGFDVVLPEQGACCGALPQHLGEREQALAMARRNLLSWQQTLYQGCDAILVAASGCSGTLAGYGTLFQDDDEMAELAAQASRRTSDIGVFLNSLDLTWQQPAAALPEFAWHAPCSLQHGLRTENSVLELLQAAGITLHKPTDAHLCCGAAGTYNVLQARMSAELGVNKATALEARATGPIVSANLGCMLQLARFSERPVLHYLELLDWMNGGQKPQSLDGF